MRIDSRAIAGPVSILTDHLMAMQTSILHRAWPALGLALLIASPTLVSAQSDKPAGKSRKSADSNDDPAKSKPGGLRMSRAVVCKAINGYEDYKPLPGAAQTSEEKLLVYFRPLRYKIEFADGLYRAHVVQDNEIRKKGEKKIVRHKKKVVEYEPKTKDPPKQLYIRNTISLKGLEPGEYDLTIILRDELDKAAPPSRQVVRFKVIPAARPPDEEAGGGARREGRRPASGTLTGGGPHAHRPGSLDPAGSRASGRGSVSLAASPRTGVGCRSHRPRSRRPRGAGTALR